MPRVSYKKSQRRFQPKANSNKRINTLFVLFVLVTGVIITRLYYLQIIKGEEYSAFARGFYLQGEDYAPPRGEIYFQDKAGKNRYLVASNEESPLVYADPKEIDDASDVLEEISKIIEIDAVQHSTILNRLENNESSYALIMKNLTKEEAEEIEALELPGIYIRNELVRVYPARETGSTILGFLGFSKDRRVGQYGIEEYYEDIISGKSANVYLTIDYGIQFVVERKLQELVDNLDADSASAIFMNPSTGEIIAMAQRPGFDPNRYNEVEDIKVFKNSLVQSVFELGSVFKPITMAAAIDGGALTPTTVYNDTGSVYISGYNLNNSDGKANGLQTMTEVLEKSLNTGIIFAQQQLGKKKFRDYLESFQLDSLTGIDLPGEVAGNMVNIKNTNRDINFATASFGQGVSFSPLRFLTSFSAIANGGNIMKPFLVKRIVQGTRETVYESEIVASPISRITASRVTAMLVSVVENGFGSKAQVAGYNVAGKTGTAEVPAEDGSGYSDKTIHSFIGFAPAYDPIFIGIIKVDNPHGIRFSADSVAPAFGDIASFILQYYKVPPQ